MDHLEKVGCASRLFLIPDIVCSGRHGMGDNLDVLGRDRILKLERLETSSSRVSTGEDYLQGFSWVCESSPAFAD